MTASVHKFLSTNLINKNIDKASSSLLDCVGSVNSSFFICAKYYFTSKGCFKSQTNLNHFHYVSSPRKKGFVCTSAVYWCFSPHWWGHSAGAAPHQNPISEQNGIRTQLIHFWYQLHMGNKYVTHRLFSCPRANLSLYWGSWLGWQLRLRAPYSKTVNWIWSNCLFLHLSVTDHTAFKMYISSFHVFPESNS